MNLLFICTGNTCRSPMAALIARTKMAELGVEGEVDSAGLYAGIGMPMSALAGQALTRRGVPLMPHASKPVTPDSVERADRVLGMTQQHLEELQRRFPEAAHKMEVLGRYLADASVHEHDCAELDIADPFGGSDESYELAAAQIETAVLRLLRTLTSHGGQSPGDARDTGDTNGDADSEDGESKGGDGA